METQTNITKPSFSIGSFFLSGALLASLITTVVAFLNLVFETLNKRFPDVLNATYEYGYSTYQYEGLRMALSTLIIIFPIFLAISYYWNKYAESGLGHWDIFVRKWFINIILLLSAFVVVADLVTLVRYFVSGEITSRFIYKVIAVLVVAGLVGYYYVIKLKEQEKPITGKIFSIIGAILVVAAIAWSFSILGSPMKQRAFRLDDRRVQDLQSIQWQVINYWQRKEKLPAKIEDLADPLSGYSLPVEPEFEKGNKYEYAVKGPLTFELCATFSQPMPKGWREYSYGGVRPMMPVFMEDKAVSYPYPGGGANESWDHEAGRTCFERTIDKDLYPPYPEPLR